MTREEAIAILQEEMDGNLELTLSEWRERDEQKLFPAIRMAIKALQADAVIQECRTHGRLIDADELKKHLDGAWEELNDDGERKGVRLARWYLISAPTVDSTIDVVRCKDCEYADFNSPYPVCNFLEMNICENGYCSWARMKGGDTE